MSTAKNSLLLKVIRKILWVVMKKTSESVNKILRDNLMKKMLRSKNKFKNWMPSLNNNSMISENSLMKTKNASKDVFKNKRLGMRAKSTKCWRSMSHLFMKWRMTMRTTWTSAWPSFRTRDKPPKLICLGAKRCLKTKSNHFKRDLCQLLTSWESLKKIITTCRGNHRFNSMSSVRSSQRKDVSWTKNLTN